MNYEPLTPDDEREARLDVEHGICLMQRHAQGLIGIIDALRKELQEKA